MGLIANLLTRWRDRPDPAAVMQTPVVKFTGYDEAKAVSSRLHALDRARWRRKVEARRATRGDNVRTFPKGEKTA